MVPQLPFRMLVPLVLSLCIQFVIAPPANSIVISGNDSGKYDFDSSGSSKWKQLLLTHKQNHYPQETYDGDNFTGDYLIDAPMNFNSYFALQRKEIEARQYVVDKTRMAQVAGNLPEMFQEKPATPETSSKAKNSKRSSTGAPAPKSSRNKPEANVKPGSSIFDERPAKAASKSMFEEKNPVSDKHASPLDDVVGAWLKQDKVKLVKEQAEKLQQQVWECKRRPTMDSNCKIDVASGKEWCGLTLTATRNFHCNTKKAMRGYSCAEQDEDHEEAWKKSWIMSPSEKRQYEKRRNLVIKKWHLKCDAFNKNGGKPSPADLAAIRNIDAQIEADARASQRAVAARAAAAREATAQPTKSEQAAYQRHQAKEQQKKDLLDAKNRQSKENKRLAKEARQQRCAQQYYKTGANFCSCDYSLIPESRNWKSCTR